MVMICRLLVLLLTVCPPLFAVPVDFVRDVKPIFEAHCAGCHGAREQKSDYRLDSRESALKGGESGKAAIVPGKPDAGSLIHLVDGTDQELFMPPRKSDAMPLNPSQIGTLRQWIAEGANGLDGQDVARSEDKTDWWSFRPLRSDLKSPVKGPKTIDAFIHAALKEKGLTPAPRADSRTLIRRLYFDLTGLPPTPDEITKYAALPYERLVDDLLASPRYGERWARHWLDLVHYGETHGYDKDKPRMNAWPYRDYIIRALNSNKPYRRFIEEQIAGDVLHPGTVDGVTALGFLAAGPWDYIGHAEVPETKIDGKIARHLDRDDMMQNAIGSFCSLTAQCAQCHNHKFDPISQEDYYSLQAVFAAIDRTEVDYYPDDALMQKFASVQKQKKQVTDEIAALEAPLKKKAGEAYTALGKRIDGAAEKGANPNAKPDYGFHSAISSTQDAVKWVQVDLGKSVGVDRIVLKPCYDEFGKIGGGFGFPMRFKIEVSEDPEFKAGVTLVWRKHDATFMNDFANPGLKPFETGAAAEDGVTGRFVRVTAVKLAPRRSDYIFALAEMEVYGSKTGPNLAAGRPVTSLDSIESAPRWRKANLTDGIAPESRTEEDKQKLIRERDALMLAQADEATKATLRSARQKRDALPRLPAPQKVYAGAVLYGSGAFKGTHGTPRVIHVLKRGDMTQPAQEVGPGSIAKISELFGLSFTVGGADESARRAALAQWIANQKNALTWRSIVNRVWQHHFGRGLVETANDFGRMGGKPSHPELLDWLAVSFRDDMGGRLKDLHKLIVMSETYRQSTGSGDDPPGSAANNRRSLELDAANVLLSHQNRRKLDAESIRDSILAVSGKLDLTMGGPSFQDFVIDKPQHSPHYEYHLHDPEDPRSHRRSIYRFIVRSQQQPFMTVMDCADPSMRVDKRNESLSPLQALALMNNGLTVTMAKHFSERVSRETQGIPARISRAFALAIGRDPQPDELDSLAAFAQSEGLENTCRVILNLNEFTFID